MADNDILHPNPTPEEPGILPEINLTPGSGGPVPVPNPQPNSDNDQASPLQEAAQQKIEGLKKQKLEETKAKIKNGFQKLTKRGPVNSPAGGVKSAGEAAKPAAQAGRRVTAEGAKKVGQAAAQGVKRVGAQAGKAVAEFVAANPEIWIPVAIILAVFIVIAIIIGIFAFSRGNGGGPPIYPTTASQRQQVTKLSALSGSQIANTVLLQQTVDTEKNRLSNAKSTIAKVYASDPTKAAAAASDLTAIITGMDEITKTADLATRQKLINDTSAALQKFGVTYPEALGLGAVSGAYLGVPGVMEAAKGDCGAASVAMVTLYYDPRYEDAGILDRSAHRSTQGGDVCVSVEYLNAHTPHKDWVRAPKSAASIEIIKRSLAGGDPVIIYGARGAIFDNSKHIFVIVGYDPADDTFFVNNPSPGGIQIHTKTPHNHLMTAANLANHLGSLPPDPVGFGHNFAMMIRGKYL